MNTLRREANVHTNKDRLSTSGGEDLTSDDAIDEDPSDMQVVLSRKKCRLSQTLHKLKLTLVLLFQSLVLCAVASISYTKNTASTQPNSKLLVGGSTSCSLKASKTLQIKKKFINLQILMPCTRVQTYQTILQRSESA